MTSALESYIRDLRALTTLQDGATPGSIRWHINWYDKRFPRKRWLYRGAGVVVLVAVFVAALRISGSVVNDASGWTSALVPAAAMVIGLNAFFGWGAAWRGFYQAKVKLEASLQAFEAGLIEAKYTADESVAFAIVKQAFDRLLHEATNAVLEETKGFFDAARFPKLLSSHRT